MGWGWGKRSLTQSNRHKPSLNVLVCTTPIGGFGPIWYMLCFLDVPCWTPPQGPTMGWVPRLSQWLVRCKRGPKGMLKLVEELPLRSRAYTYIHNILPYTFATGRPAQLVFGAYPIQLNEMLGDRWPYLGTLNHPEAEHFHVHAQHPAKHFFTEGSGHSYGGSTNTSGGAGIPRGEVGTPGGSGYTSGV